MKLTEMQTVAQKVLADFIRMMPDAPFTENGIVIEFAPKNKMVERAKALCALYVPDKTFSESQMWELENIIGGNALIGREKSAVLIRVNSKLSVKDLREIVYHELVHIFCGKMEMDGEHFIDTYGSGHTPDENPENVLYDGQLNAGYVVWSEFIAQYYALRYVHQGGFPSSWLSAELIGLLDEVHAGNFMGSKRDFSMVCSYMLACSDVERLLERLKEPGYIFDDDKPFGAETRSGFNRCLQLLNENLKKEKPWKITRHFIEELGVNYIAFFGMNSIYLGFTPADLLGGQYAPGL